MTQTYNIGDVVQYVPKLVNGAPMDINHYNADYEIYGVAYSFQKDYEDIVRTRIIWTDDLTPTGEDLVIAPHMLYVGNIEDDGFVKNALVNSFKYGSRPPDEKTIKLLKELYEDRKI